MSVKIQVLALIVIAGLAGAASLQHLYDLHHDYLAERDIFFSLPSGKTMQILSFGFDSLLADAMHIWAIQLYSTPQYKNRFDFAERLFNAITDLSPQYRDPYSTGTLVLAEEKGDIPATLRLLDKGIKNFPDDWSFYNEAGFYCYHSLKDYKRAEEYYNRGIAVPSAPDYIKRVKAHMVYLQDDLSGAWQLWMDIYQNSKDKINQISAFNHLFQIKSEQDLKLLREGIAAYQARFRELPASLQDLQTRRILDSIPRDFSGKEYVYDPASGAVKAKREFRWKKFR